MASFLVIRVFEMRWTTSLSLTPQRFSSRWMVRPQFTITVIASSLFHFSPQHTLLDEKVIFHSLSVSPDLNINSMGTGVCVYMYLCLCVVGVGGGL